LAILNFLPLGLKIIKILPHHQCIEYTKEVNFAKRNTQKKQYKMKAGDKNKAQTKAKEGISKLNPTE